MVEQFPAIPATTVTVTGYASPAQQDQNARAHQLLIALGVTGATTRVFAGHFFAADGADPFSEDVGTAYAAPQHITAFQMERDAGLARANDKPNSTFSWTGEELHVSYTHRDGQDCGRYELAPLGPGQRSLAGRLARHYVPDVTDGALPWVSALDVPDPIAAIVARVGDTRSLDVDEEPDFDDPTGLLGFAHDLLCAGVERWAPEERNLLSGLAQNWAGTCRELLSVAHTVGACPAALK